MTSYPWDGTMAEYVYSCGSRVKTYGREIEGSSQLFNLTDTRDDEVAGFVDYLMENGWELKSPTSIEGNNFFRLTHGRLKVSINYYGNTNSAAIVADQSGNVSPDDISYTYEPKTGEAAEVYMFGLKMDPFGYNWNEEGNTNGYPNNGECLVIKCADNSVIIVDGGEKRQMAADDQTRFIKFLHEITGKSEDEAITISAWYITHFHGDHVLGMCELLKNNSKKFRLERVICNMPSLQAVSTSKPNKTNFQNPADLILKYYPKCQEIKVHTGDVLRIADVTMTTLFTHEDIVDPTGKFTSTDFNTTSTVMKIEAASGMSMVVTGDMSVEAETILCRNFSPETLKCHILQQPHHNLNNNEKIYEFANTQVMLFTQREGQFDKDSNRRSQAYLAQELSREWYCQGDKTVGFGVVNGKVKLIYEENLQY